MGIEKLRNIGIIAHIDAGKTTTSERILYFSGRIHRMGEVHDGDTVMDWREDEQQRGITIAAAASRLEWHDHAINLIDTPGHVDFTAEVERSLRVIDGAIVVLCGVAGVEAQSETVWRQADRYHVPRICFVNKLDRPGADHERAVESLRQRLGAHPILVQLPIVDDESHEIELIDLVGERLLSFDPDDPKRVLTAPIPGELAGEAAAARAAMLEAIADADDPFAEQFLNEEPVSVAEIRSALRRATLSRRAVPVLCGSALRTVGIPPLLDAVVDYLPSPLDVPVPHGYDPRTNEPTMREPSVDAPFSALVFKVQVHTASELYFLRIYSGSLAIGDAPICARTRKREKIHDVIRVHAKTGVRMERALAGDIVAVPGLKNSVTGDTLHDEAHPIAYESMVFPEPVVSLAVEPKSAAGRKKLEDALARLVKEDPTFSFSEDQETGQTVLFGMGELHLEILTNRLIKEFHCEINIGKPRVAYRETIARPAEAERECQRVVAGKPAHGSVKLRLSPSDGRRARWAADTDLSVNQRAQLLEFLEGELQGTGLHGYPLRDVEATILAVGRRDADPQGHGLPFALNEAFDAALREAGTDVLEPVMRIEVTCPHEYLGGIHRALQAKRAVIEEILEEDLVATVRGTVPMSEMFGFSSDLRTISQGRASFTMEPAGYQAIPPERMAEMFGSG